MKTKLSTCRRRGFTLTEIAIVLGVIGIVIGGVWLVASMVRENARISQAAGQLNMVAQNMTSLMQGGYNPATGSITTAMITAQVIPTWAATTTTTASHPWKSDGFTMTWVTSSPRTYRMIFTQITRQGCVGLINQVTGCTPGQAGCPTNIVSGSGGTNYSTSTLTTDIIQTICDANSYTTGTNMLGFDFTN